MIKLRNLPFFGIAIVFILFASLVFHGGYAITGFVFAVIYLILGIANRNPEHSAHGGGHH